MSALIYVVDDHRASADALGEVLEDLDARFPGLRFRVVDEQGVTRRHIKFFIGDAHNDDLSAPIPPGLPVHIVAALSGG